MDQPARRPLDTSQPGMPAPIGARRSATSQRRGRLTGALVSGVLAIAALAPSLPAEAAPAPIPGDAGLAMAVDRAGVLASDGRRLARQARQPGEPIDLGRDGRWTILLLGSDWRPTAGGERLDVILVMSIDPVTKRASAVSIPRDMVSIPRSPRNGGGDSGATRVNSMYYIDYRAAGLPHEAVDGRAVGRFRMDIERLLGTEIDDWALIRFGDFAAGIDTIGGIRVDNRVPIVDPAYHSGPSHGIYFPRAKDYRLAGNPDCKPYPKACRSALAYARSRKGMVGDRANTDYARASRHPRIVMGAVRRVVEGQGAGLILIALLAKLRGRLFTSVPTTPTAAAQLYRMLEGATLPPDSAAVLAPGRFAYTDATTALYTYRPDLQAIRRWVDRAFAKVKPPAPDGSASPAP